MPRDYGGVTLQGLGGSGPAQAKETQVPYAIETDHSVVFSQDKGRFHLRRDILAEYRAVQAVRARRERDETVRVSEQS